MTQRQKISVFCTTCVSKERNGCNNLRKNSQLSRKSTGPWLFILMAKTNFEIASFTNPAMSKISLQLVEFTEDGKMILLLTHISTTETGLINQILVNRLH